MPHVIARNYPPGRTDLYAVLEESATSARVPGASGWVAYSASARNASAVALSDAGTPGRYSGTLPAWLTAAGDYPVTVCQRAGGSPAESDPVVGEEVLVLGGSLGGLAADLNAALLGPRAVVGSLVQHRTEAGETRFSAPAAAADGAFAGVTRP